MDVSEKIQQTVDGSRPGDRGGRLRRNLMWMLPGGALLAALGALSLPSLLAQSVPSPISPTVFPVLHPHSSINIPMTVSAEHTSVWVTADGIQHILLVGDVHISVGYRRLWARQAALWLMPVSSGATGVYKATIYLQGDAQVSEGPLGQALSTAPEMLISTRISARVRLAGAAPVAQVESSSPVVVRGRAIMRQLARRPAPLAFIPTVEIQPLEMALTQGWLARGSNNKRIVIPTRIVVQKPPTVPPRHPLVAPAPSVWATGKVIQVRRIGNQRVTVVQGRFFLVRQTHHGQPPLELRANDAVLFSPVGTAAPGGKSTVEPSAGISQKVQGVYMQGDVTITLGDQTVHADKVYYDFTTNRAIMLNAVLSTYDLKNKSPLYMRAKEILQLAQGRFAAKSVKLSTDEFYVPHYYIGASAMTLRSLSGPVRRTPGPLRRNVYAFTATNVTGNIMGVPFFYWPYLAGTTRRPTTPLRRLNVGFSSIYGATLETGWNLFDLVGYPAPKNVHARLNVDYFSKRGPGIGVDSRYQFHDAHGVIHSFIMYDKGTDNLGANRENLPLPTHVRGYISARHMQKLSRQWTLAVEGSYISDPNFLEQYFPYEYATSSEQQTSIYLKQQHHTEAFTILGKWNLNNFVSNADLENNEFSVQRYPEAHYWRVGDKLLGLFTYYSDSSGGLLNDKFSQTTPATRGLQLNFPGMNPNETFANYYLNNGWTSRNIARFDSRQEIDMPLAAGPIQFVPFVTGRLTYWDTRFPVANNQTGGGTTRAWGMTGFRSTATFWRVYNGVNSNFLDVHGLRHVIEPEVDLFVSGTNVPRGYLQPFDRNVEGITNASGAQFALRQVFQTKRGLPGKRQMVNWITLNISADMFWNQSQSQTGPFNAANPMYAGAPFSTSDFGQPLIGYYDFSRPELSQIADSLNASFTWRAGANVRFLGDESYNMDLRRLEEVDTGMAVDQSPSLSYFLGNRYIEALTTDQWTFAVNYRLTRKYSISAAESYDFSLVHNIASEITVVRQLPRLYAGLTLSYNADTRSTAVFVSLWPAGYPQFGITSPTALAAAPQY
jgi:hypothetical protein